MNAVKNTNFVVKQIWQWLIHHQLLTAFSVLILLIITLNTPVAKEIYNVLQQPVFFSVQPANHTLATEVKNSVRLLDSVDNVRDKLYYQLNIIVAKKAQFIPVGVQFVDANTIKPITSKRLTRQNYPLWCWDYRNLDNETNYQTERLSEDWVHNFAPSVYRTRDDTETERRRVNLIVRVENTLFLIDGLEVSGVCSSSITD